MQKRLRAVALLSGLGLAAGCSSNTPNLVRTPSTPGPLTPLLATETNGTSGNAVLTYARKADGSLTSIGSFPTGGSGVGLPSSGLPFPIGGATGAVALSPDGTHLYAADAGSDDVAAFTVAPSGTLTLIGRFRRAVRRRGASRSTRAHAICMRSIRVRCPAATTPPEASPASRSPQTAL